MRQNDTCTASFFRDDLIIRSTITLEMVWYAMKQ
jgi:hypothetical protein